MMFDSRIFIVSAIAISSLLLSPARSEQQVQSGQMDDQKAPAASSTSGQPRIDPPGQKSGPPSNGTNTAPGGQTEPTDPQKQCVKPGEFAVELRSGRNPVGAPIVLATNFLPTNQRVDIGVRAPFVDGVRYFAGIDYGDETYLLKRQDAVTHRATESDPLVQKHLLEPDQTIVTLNMGDDLAWYWSRVDLYLYTCNNPVGQSPWRVSSVSIRLSPYWFSVGAVVAEVLILYFWIAFALRKPDHSFGSFLRALNPAQVSAGPDGKGSLSTFQTLAFSLAVAALITLLLLQTGTLVDLSGSILTLLGISGIGSTIAKGTDSQRNTLSADNRAWLLRHNWISMAKTVVDPSNATWRDFFTTDGVFDVYRYQSFIFGLVVIGGLIAAGANQLSTFVVPNTILGIVGLSQVVYIGGKLVTPTNISDLNAAISGLRSDELKLKVTAVAAKQGQLASLTEAIPLMGPGAYHAYRQKARDVAAIFTDATGIGVADVSLDPIVT
jgi:outer membrane murein-binding lipoprotein Lpp